MAKGKNTKEVILTKGVQLFLRKGYERTSMRDLAKAVGIQAPGIYHHFRSKKDLLKEINERSWEQFCVNIFDRVRELSDPEEKIEAYIRNMIKYQFLLGQNTLIVDDDISMKHLKERRERDRLVFDFLRNALREVAEKRRIKTRVDPTLAAFSLYSMTARAYKWFKPGGKLSLEELADQTTRLFLNGYCGVAPRKERKPGK